MSKHRPPASPVSPQTSAMAGAVSADSSVQAIRAERSRVFDELLRRQEYQLLVALRARLDDTPPVPELHPPPANQG
ncbi:hypothetical protein [Caulobacter segnis]|uniref:Exocyst complex component Sec3, putative n=1 Tax=Caulobacter segnis (strain ATCC 21756 / DSM 7131 / JCM 7823 / NBRC 15250 / LMG 17158 / TK0059) TaxID=509190 RepID=D5VPC5_CAUST|nr:hypothetical protein [Caulobacter segnis]ADG12348.1 Exocyst complex component Sec3, putative [Caulobacter segnis ATCC 21756]